MMYAIAGIRGVRVPENKTVNASDKSFSGRKRGLVLEGGGAKGAYAFGCLLAFKEYGIKFDAVAGTSIGGINAACWATEALDEGEKLWRSLRPTTLMHSAWLVVSLLIISFFLPLLGLILAIFFVVLVPFNLLNEFLIGRSDYLNKMGLGIVIALTILWCSVAATYYIAHVWMGISLTSTVIACMYAALWALMVCVKEMRLQALAIGAFFLVALFLVNIGGVLLAGGYRFFSSGMPVDFNVTSEERFILRLTIYVICALIITFAYFKISRRVSLLNQKPLRSLISRILNRPLVIPTYVCVALKTHVIDHKNPTSVFSSEVDGIGTVLPTLLGAYVPKYLRLDSMSDIENKVDVLLATSALPLGIFPPVALEGGSYVDGGTMDNLPVYPLINGERIGELVIIHLTSQRWTGEDYVTHYNNCHTNTLLEEHTNELAKRIRQMKYPKGDRGGFEHSHNIHKESERILKDLKTRGAKSDPMRIGITRIAPSESLGGFLTGTLRFTPGYVDRLIRQGKSDATKIILSGAI